MTEWDDRPNQSTVERGIGMSDLIVSVIRTQIPVLVGLIVIAATKVGADIDSAALAVMIDALAIGLYYTVVRALEQRWSKAGVLLGVPRRPAYTPPPAQ